MAGESGRPDEVSDKTRRILDRAQAAEEAEFGGDADIKTILESDGVRAAYKIEVLFGPKRTTQGPNVCLVQLWESGKHFHGGGDAVMYTCLDGRQLKPTVADKILRGMHKEPDKFDWVGGCGKVIPSANIRQGVAFCSACQNAINVQYAPHLLPFAGISTRRLCAVLELLFHQLKDNADIYCKFFRDDIRYQAMQKAYGEEKARRHRGLSIYPLKNLLRDTSGGASVEDQIFKFLTA